MPELTLGISPCPNDVYTFSGILLGQVPTGDIQFRTDFQDVETLNRRAQAGDIDIVKVSYANYPRCAAQYDLLSSGGALGRGVGPLLLMHGEQWDPDREVLVPGEATTANFLMDFYAGRTLRKRFLPFDALYAELKNTPGAQGVVIHEKRFSFAQDGLTLTQDLGAFWEQQTGFPIPLGAILTRKTLHLTSQIDQCIRASLAWADAHYAEAFTLCRIYASDFSDGSIESHISLYVNAYTRDLGPDGRAAVKFFLEQYQAMAPPPQ